MAGNHCAPGQEKFVKAVCKLSILINNNFFVLYNVVVPGLDGMCVVDALVAYAHDLEATFLELACIPVHRAGCISAREDVLTHENSPNKIFVGPVPTQSGNLEEENTVGLEERLDLSHIILIVANANVLAHLKACDLVEGRVDVRSEGSVVFLDNFDFVLKILLFNAPCGPFKLVL